jgi:hypothetical protein
MCLPLSSDLSERGKCSKSNLRPPPAGILAPWDASRYCWFQSWAQPVHWQQLDYTQLGKGIWEVVEARCSVNLISDLRANTARSAQVADTYNMAFMWGLPSADRLQRAR